MSNKIVTVLFLALPCIATAHAVECHSDRLTASTPTSIFTRDAEIVTDKQTTLSWMRCAVGQQWNGNSCEGSVQTVNWQQAMALVNKINAEGVGGFHDWRMPLMPELASIVERQCFNPRMNTEVFPGAPSVVFWTGMEKMGSPDYVYTLDFGGGAAMARTKETAGAVRLVRGGPWWQPPAMMSQR